MKLLYIVNARIPTEKAHGIQIVKMCESFSKAGFDVTLVIPRRLNHLKQTLSKYYNIEKNFKILKLPTIDLLCLRISVFSYVQTASFFVSLLVYLLFSKTARKSLIYTRGETSTVLSLFPNGWLNWFWESHVPTKTKAFYGRVLNTCKGIIVITSRHKEELLDEYMLPEDKVFLFPDAVDLRMFNNSLSIKEAREKLNLPLNKKIVMYTGSDLPWKGLYVLRKAAADCRLAKVLFVFVGPIKRVEKSTDNQMFVGHKPFVEIPCWLSAADVLVLTGTRNASVSEFYTSPMKLFEYMASGKSIVASDLNSFRDILTNNKNAILVNPDSVESIVTGLEKVIGDEDIAQRIGDQAKDDVSKLTWTKRGEAICEFIKSRIN